MGEMGEGCQKSTNFQLLSKFYGYNVLPGNYDK